MSRLGASNVAIISCLGPVVTLMLSAILLKEIITVWQIMGTIIIMGGILIINLEKKVEPVKQVDSANCRKIDKGQLDLTKIR
jgi:drug/metabolite transporter (DMT)-like permease